METPVLEVANVSVCFGGLTAVQNMSFSVNPNEAIGLIGPNGAGKSTLLSVIAGACRPSAGMVKFRGHNITGMSQHKLCHRGIGRTYQIPQPFINLTVRENIMVAAEYGAGRGRRDAEREVTRILEMVDLRERRDVLARDLAAITLKRLELARALASNPTLLLLDEVAAGLNDEEIPKMLEILRRVREAGITYIVIEHVMRVLTQVVDRIVVMDRGEKLVEGLPMEVMNDERVIAAYLGDED